MKNLSDFKTFQEQRSNPDRPIIRLRYRLIDGQHCLFDHFATLSEARARFLSMKRDLDFMDIYDTTTNLCLDSWNRKKDSLFEFAEFLKTESQTN